MKYPRLFYYASVNQMDTLNISKLEQAVIDKARALRLERGWSQRDLSDFLGLSHGFVARVESPKYRAKYNLHHVEKLAQAFNCSPCDLLPATLEEIKLKPLDI